MLIVDHKNSIIIKTKNRHDYFQDTNSNIHFCKKIRNSKTKVSFS